MLPRVVATGALALLLVGCGCGGKSHPASSAGPGTRLAARDRVAYYQIATTSGLLRARAATLLSGRRGTPKATLEAAAARLALLDPQSPALAAMRASLSAAVARLLRADSRTAARAAMRASDRVNAALQRYSRGKAVRELVPD